MATSLQRAVTKQVSKESNSTNGEPEMEKGAFETCFAGSLDLSEFADDQGKNCSVEILPRRSAAAELLKVKAQEREQQERQQIEEEKMGSIVQRRALSLKATMVKRQQQRLLGRNSSQSAVTTALITMHQSDQSQRYGISHKKFKNQAPKSKMSRRPSGNTSLSRKPASKVVKKAKRSKF